MQILRSWLFVPGNQLKLINKASTLDADVLIYDLEDSVPSSEKERGRLLIAKALQMPKGRSLRYVRMQATAPSALEDLYTVACSGLNGLVMPKVEMPDDIQWLDAALSSVESDLGIKSGSIGLLATIESARGLLAAPAIAAACQRVMGLFFGAEDYSLDLGIFRLDDDSLDDMLYARSAVAVAAASYGLVAVDRVVPEFSSLDRLDTDARQAYRLGYSGKAVIHPQQINRVHKIFSPTDKDVEKALKVINSFEQVHKQGVGSIQVDGRMVDLPIIEKARHIVKLAKALKSPKSD